MKYWPGWLLLKSHFQAFSVITSRVNISCREQVFWPTKGTGGLQHHKFLIFEGKHHPKNIWFHGCWNHPWLLFLCKIWMKYIINYLMYFINRNSNVKTIWAWSVVQNLNIVIHMQVRIFSSRPKVCDTVDKNNKGSSNQFNDLFK